jgi:hypothetical protein
MEMMMSMSRMTRMVLAGMEDGPARGWRRRLGGKGRPWAGWGSDSGVFRRPNVVIAAGMAGPATPLTWDEIGRGPLRNRRSG